MGCGLHVDVWDGCLCAKTTRPNRLECIRLRWKLSECLCVCCSLFVMNCLVIIFPVIKITAAQFIIIVIIIILQGLLWHWKYDRVDCLGQFIERTIRTATEQTTHPVGTELHKVDFIAFDWHSNDFIMNVWRMNESNCGRFHCLLFQWSGKWSYDFVSAMHSVAGKST